MLKHIKRFFDRLFDDVVWVVVQQDNKKSIKFTWSAANDYAKNFGGEIKHSADLENLEFDSERMR